MAAGVRGGGGTRRQAAAAQARERLATRAQVDGYAGGLCWRAASAGLSAPGYALPGLPVAAAYPGQPACRCKSY